MDSCRHLRHLLSYCRISDAPRILTALGLTLLVAVAFTAILPTAAQAQGTHGITFSKGCDSPTPIGGAYNCAYGVGNFFAPGVGDTGDNTPPGDTLTFTSIVDVVHANPSDVSSGNILSSLTVASLTGGAFCDVSGTNTGAGATGNTKCTIPSGGSISFAKFSFYNVDIDDPDQLTDTATLTWQDTCDSGANNCPVGDQTSTTGSQTTLTCPVCTPINECNTATCNEATNECEQTAKSDSTPCTDSDGNACTTAGCEAGQCVQNHIPVVCDPQTNECKNPNVCDPADGICKATNKADSTACTDSDGNACTTAGCEAGQCVQNHIPVVCDPQTNECKNPNVCDPADGICKATNKADSTACTDSDGNACTTAGCEAGQCVQNHIPVVCDPQTNECKTPNVCDPADGLCKATNKADSTPCTDSDNDECTIAGCEAGSCVQKHLANDQCVTEVCRTPGFWGTHPVLTDLVIGFADNETLNICGEKITNIAVNDAASAIEAICVAPQGNQRLQLARQLTAAALNCLVTNGNADCSGVPSIGTTFATCNALCAAGPTSEVTACISAIDAFNNGQLSNCHTQDVGFCKFGKTVTSTFCSANEPCAEGGTCVPGSADSSACDAANGNSCTVLPGTGGKKDVGEDKCNIDSAP